MVRETGEQAEARLRKVIAGARFEALEGTYAFRELLDGPRELNANALACVRDDRTWSQLVPVSATDPRQGQFRMFSFHFAADLDASGFVAWLASHLKRTVGTGVMSSAARISAEKHCKQPRRACSITGGAPRRSVIG